MTRTAKLFKNGGSQAVRLPTDFRFPGEEVFIEKIGETIILRAKKFQWDDFFARKTKIPSDFLSDRDDPSPENR